MSKKLLLGLMITLLALSIFAVSIALAQDPGDEATSKGEVLSESNDDVVTAVEPELSTVGPPAPRSIAGISSLPANELPPIDLSNLKTPDGQTLPNPNALKQQQLAFINSLTDAQRAQIKALLAANLPAYMEEIKAVLGNPVETGNATKLTSEQLQLMDQTGRQWANSINAGIKGVLTPEQVVAFDNSLLPHPEEWSAKLGLSRGDITAQTQNDCYYSYVYAVDANTYAYYQYLNGYYAYLYETDPYNLYVYLLGYDSYLASYYAYVYSAYAYYYYYDATYSFYAFYFDRHTYGFTFHGYDLAYASYTWTGGGYAYAAYVYGYYANASIDTAVSYGDGCYFN